MRNLLNDEKVWDLQKCFTVTYKSTGRQVGRYIGRQADPIITFGPNEMIGRAYYMPVTATDTGPFSLFVRAFDY